MTTEKPISGGVSIQCKTERCSGGFTGSFVFDLSKYIEEFKDIELKCVLCEKTHIYTRKDVTLTPAIVP
jgi:hypothetical protein